MQQEGGAFFHGHVLPRFIRGERGLHRELGVLGSCLLMDAHDLRRIGGIEGLDLSLGAQTFSANHELVFVAEHVRDLAERGFHRDEVGGVVEIDKGLVAELTPGAAGQDHGADVRSGSHSQSSLVHFAADVRGWPDACDVLKIQGESAQAVAEGIRSTRTRQLERKDLFDIRLTVLDN